MLLLQREKGFEMRAMCDCVYYYYHAAAKDSSR